MTGVPAAGEALDATRTRVLQAVLAGAPGTTVGALADELGGHPNTTRHHLRALVAAGLVEPSSARGAARGRPAVRYAVTPAGRRAALASETGAGDPGAEEYVALAAAFADRLAAHGADPSEEARSVGRAWGRALATGGAPPEPRQGVLALLDRLGFSPEVAPGEVTEHVDRELEVRLRTCPLLDAARRHPHVVCQVHAGLVEGADAAFGGAGEDVVLRPFAVPGACLLVLPPGR